MTTVRFGQKPYNRVIEDRSGETQVVRRRPAKKLHNILPKDEVELGVRRSELFPEGEVYKVKHINRREPNLLQLENSDGETTFVPHYDVELDEAIAPRGQRNGVMDHPVDNAYLRWP